MYLFIMKIEELLEKVNQKKFKLYSRIINNLENLKLKGDQIKDILKILDKILIKFMKNSLYLRSFKTAKDPIPKPIIDTDISEDIKELKVILVKKISRFKINNDSKKLFTKNLSINIDELVTFGTLYRFIKNFPIIKHILELYREMDYIEGLQKIYLTYDKARVLEAFSNSNLLLMEIYRDELDRILYYKQYDRAYLNKNIEKYNDYLEMPFTERLGLQEILNKFIMVLTRHKENRKDIRQHNNRSLPIKKYKEEHKNWLEERFEIVLNMCREARGNKNIGFLEEAKTVDDILSYLKAKYHEMKNTTKKARLLYAEKILKIIYEYEKIYPAVTGYKEWAEEKYNKYKYLIKK